MSSSNTASSFFDTKDDDTFTAQPLPKQDKIKKPAEPIDKPKVEKPLSKPQQPKPQSQTQPRPTTTIPPKPQTATRPITTTPPRPTTTPPQPQTPTRPTTSTPQKPSKPQPQAPLHQRPQTPQKSQQRSSDGIHAYFQLQSTTIQTAVYEYNISYLLSSKWFFDDLCRVVCNERGFYVNIRRTKKFVLVRGLQGGTPYGSIWIKRPTLQGWCKIIFAKPNGEQLVVGIIKQAGGGLMFKQDQNISSFMTIKIK